MSYKHHLAASGFSISGASGLYDKARPTYPKEVIQRIVCCLPKEDGKVIELGAGTGIFTRAFLSNLEEGQLKSLTAIEPSEGMRTGFERAMAQWTQDPNQKMICSQLVCQDGSFDRIGSSIPNESVDLVAAAQAWHWTGSDPETQEKCISEVARVLKPGGHFALLWNLKDREAAKWVGDVRDAYEIYEAGTPQYRLGLWKCLFKTATFRSQFKLIEPSELENLNNKDENNEIRLGSNVNDSIDNSKPTLSFKKKVPTSLESLYDRICSKSFMTELDDQIKLKFKNQLKSIWDDQVINNSKIEWLDDQTIGFPYVTHLYLLQKK